MEKKEKNRNSYSELPEGEEAASGKTIKKESRKSKENREIRILKKSKSIKEKNDPERFSGDGINFRAKIIGIEDVFDARGNRMCQGALQKLKAAVKTSGDHKQRIILNISLEGIIIKDEKSGEILHHHPIHKISCISQDTKDSRAFGFVYGCPQTGHRFFAIKTEKAASQVVVTLRDLFLVALEIKKKEIEKAVDTQIEENGEQENKSEEEAHNGLSNGNTASSGFFESAFENGRENQRINHDLLYSNTVLLPEEVVPEKCKPNHTEPEPEPEPAVDTLLDLQSEVNILQQGISQMDQTIAHAVSQSLGISFSEDEISESSVNSVPTSFQFKLDKLSSLYHETMSISSRSSSTSDYNVCVTENKQEENDTPKKDPFVNPVPLASEGCSSGVSSLSVGGSSSVSEMSHANSTSTSAVEDKYAVFLDIDSLPSIFDDPSIVKIPEEKVASVDITNESQQNSTQEECEAGEEESEVKSSTPVPFAELDPLGNQPYVDKRDFFQDIKNPPKKVLKDLVGANNVFYGSLDMGDAFTNSQECLTFSDLKFNNSESFESVPPLMDPPRLPPKRVFGAPSEMFEDNGLSDSNSIWEPKNPFNPFLSKDYPDTPPPSSPPPPPPPRLPSKTSESSLCMSPPPPRPPSRVNCIPTPPLPKRKVPLSSTHRTWFSFDQDTVASSTSPPPTSSFFPAEVDNCSIGDAPPLPSPARKLPPPSKPESPLLKSSSASNSPATVRRLYNKNSFLGNTVVIKENSDTSNNQFVENIAVNRENKTSIGIASPRRLLSRHSSIMQEGEAFSGATVFNPFLEIGESRQQQKVSESNEESNSPPLPPKPAAPVYQLRPVPTQKMAPVLCTSSFSSSNMSVTESSNGTHSSSSLVFSSSGEKFGSSSEALFANSSAGSQTDVSVRNISRRETLQSQSSNGVTEEDPDHSPDSIFRRKSDPFADDFFLSLHKKSNGDTQSTTKTSSTVVEVPFDNLKAPT